MSCREAESNHDIGLLAKETFFFSPDVPANEMPIATMSSVLILYSVSVPPPCYRSGTLKDPGHTAKSAGGRLQTNTHIYLTQGSRSRLIVLSRHSGEAIMETSSYARRQEIGSSTVVSAR